MRIGSGVSFVFSLIVTLTVTYSSAQTLQGHQCAIQCFIQLNGRTGSTCGFTDVQCICRLSPTNRIFEDCLSRDCAADGANFARRMCASVIAEGPLPTPTATPSFSSFSQLIPTFSSSRQLEFSTSFITPSTISLFRPTFTLTTTTTATSTATSRAFQPSNRRASEARKPLVLIIAASLVGAGLLAGLFGYYWCGCGSRRKKATKLAPAQGTLDPATAIAPSAPPVFSPATTLTTPRQSLDSRLANSIIEFDSDAMVSKAGANVTIREKRTPSPDSFTQELGGGQAGADDRSEKFIETVPRVSPPQR